MWIRRVFRQGGSLAVVIPRAVATAVKLKARDHVTITLDKSMSIVLRRYEREKQER